MKIREHGVTEIGQVEGAGEGWEARWGRRRRAFGVIAGFMAASGAAFGLFTAVFGILSEGQAMHALHNAVVASLLLVLSAPAAFAAARRPERAARPLVHLAVMGTAAVVTMILGLRVDVYTLPFIVFAGVLFLLRVPRDPALPAGRPSLALGVLVTAAAVPLVVYALGQAELQRMDVASQHAQLNHWVETSFYAVAVLLLGGLAALRPAAYRPSAWSAGVALAVLGGASLLLEGRASAVDASWAWAALAGGMAFVGVAEWEARRPS